MFPIDPMLSLGLFLQALALGGFLGFLSGRLVGGLMGQRASRTWLDVVLGAMGAFIAIVVVATRDRHAVYDGQILSLRDLVLNFQAGFAVTCSVILVVVRRLVWPLNPGAAEKSRAA